jgi:GNAT superfamily N-acetyltransferase
MARFIFSGYFFRPKNLRMILAFLLSLLKGEFRMSEINTEYPATLHINIAKGFRGSGTGRCLVKALEDYLRSRNVTGMHLATMSESSGEFFRKQGFTLLHRYPRSYFRHILGRDIIVYVYGKKLS